MIQEMHSSLLATIPYQVHSAASLDFVATSYTEKCELLEEEMPSVLL